MSAKPKPDVDPYADETGPFISPALFDDINGADPSPAALAWLRRKVDAALADPDAGVPAEEVFSRLQARFGQTGSRLAD